VPHALVLLIGGVLAALVGSILILPILRTRGHYAALITVAFGILFRTFVEVNDALGGPQGLQVRGMNLFGWELNSPVGDLSFYANYVVVGLALAAAAFVLVRRLERSWVGLNLDAVRLDETAAAVFGIDVARWKILAFTCGNFFAGVAGAAYAMMTGFVAPNSFTFGDSLILVSIVLLGGLGSAWGVPLAAGIVLLVPEKLQALQEYRFLLYAVLMIVILLVRPQGLISRPAASIFQNEFSQMSEALLSCSGLSVRFGGLVALDALDLEVRSGAILGLIGPNGSGKTTLFNVITGVYRAAGGHAQFGGQDLTGMTPQRIYAAGVTRTFQRSRLALPLSVFDNVMIGNHRRLHHGLWFNLFRRSELRREFERNLAKARALVATFSARLAERMFDAVGAFGMIDRRRIEICRALVSEPRLLLLDEPSAGMTHEETRELMDDLLAVRARLPGLSVVIIEHEMNVIERVCERCAVLNYGRKIAEGSYAQVAADPQVQVAYLGTE